MPLTPRATAIAERFATSARLCHVEAGVIQDTWIPAAGTFALA
jgi:hypothetical protein